MRHRDTEGDQAVNNQALCPQCGAARVGGAAFCGRCGRQWDASRDIVTGSAAVMPDSTWIKRGLILVGLFFLSLPGWLVGVYLILKWTGLIRGMSYQNELAAGWSTVSFVVVFLGVALADIAVVGPGGYSNDYHIWLWLAAPVLAAAGTFVFVRAHGLQVTKNPDWRGFWIGAITAVVAIAVSAGSYEKATYGGGMYVVAYGAVLVGGLMALRSLRRPDPEAGPHQVDVPSGKKRQRR